MSVAATARRSRPWAHGRLKIDPSAATVEIVVDDDDDDDEAVSRSVSTPKNPTGPRSDSSTVANVGFRAKAQTLLVEALGGGRGVVELASAIIDAFVKAAGESSKASHRLRSLIAALRNNDKLRDVILSGGISCAVDVALQDPREWATDNLKARRQFWATSAMNMASQVGGDIRSCPQCGGKAVLETGTSAAYKMAKAYVHYRCMEVHCGLDTHVKE
eukprot:TRINITY_DN7655_c0_g1_i1.p1 TRINITY_DN7655_c0_g1~~TRINITY_DN7655_c0_g1_i1.p1  ORF type:complete len:217 (+),score=33.07 TRINITY_DN7655_c0_g1_i1:120-770(+)